MLRRGLLYLTIAAMLIYGAYIIHDASKPEISSILVTEDEKVIAALHTSAPPLISKYRINRSLPPGTAIKVWVESYINGERADDIASCQLVVERKTKNLPIIVFRSGSEIAVAVGSSEQSRGSFPVVESEYQNAGAGTLATDDKFEAPMTLQFYFSGSSLAGNGTCLSAMDEFIKGTAAVQLLKVEIRRPGK